MKLLYVMDPLCGWCYGNAATIEKLQAEFQQTYEFEVIPGGMLAGKNARTQTASFRNYVLAADKRIAAMTGTEFGEAYFDSLNNTTRVLDSEPPSRAIVVIKYLWPEKTIGASSLVQRARFVFGKDLNDEETYRGICESLDLDWNRFIETFRADHTRAATHHAFAVAHRLTSGFPTLLLDHGDSACVLAHGYAPYEQVAAKLESLATEQQ
jgi:putative protein-disulfide isomerase